MISRPAYLSAEERCEVTVETVIDLAAGQRPALQSFNSALPILKGSCR
jgi:hypothetical protein